MPTLWTSRAVDAPAAVVWQLLTDVDAWPGLPATDHRVETVGPERCRVGIGVPAPAAGYLLVCRLATARIARMAVASPSDKASRSSEVPS